MKMLRMAQRALMLSGLMIVLNAGSAVAQNQAVGFTPGMPFSNAFVAVPTNMAR
jgi:2-iminobutanoate/2-iminopropanoate deaminase